MVPFHYFYVPFYFVCFIYVIHFERTVGVFLSIHKKCNSLELPKSPDREEDEPHNRRLVNVLYNYDLKALILYVNIN